jgi:hypothetical protein
MSVRICAVASARERLHASIAYGRQIGNGDPDVDPVTSLRRSEPAPIVEN